MKLLPVVVLLLSTMLAGQFVTQAQQQTYQGPLVDAHGHTPNELLALETNIAPVMNQAGVTKMVLMGHEPKPAWPIGEDDKLTLQMYEKYPDQVIPFLCCIRWGHSLRDPAWMEYANQQLATRKFKGVGQLIIKRYRSHDPKDPDSKISDDLPWDSPMAQNLVRLAATHNVPLMFMMESTPETLPALDLVLQQNPNTKFIWNHQNQLQDRIGPTPDLRALSGDPQRVAAFMEKYPNLILDLTIGRDAVVRTVSDRQIPEKWRNLYVKYSDRIVIGVDADAKKGFSQYYLSEINWIRTWIGQLDNDAQKKLAYENIERLITPTRSTTVNESPVSRAVSSAATQGGISQPQTAVVIESDSYAESFEVEAKDNMRAAD